MTITTLSSRPFSRDLRRAKLAADKGPVVITERGAPAYVLLRYDEYRRLTRGGPTIRELLDLPGTEVVALDPPRLGGGIFRPADLD